MVISMIYNNKKLIMVLILSLLISINAYSFTLTCNPGEYNAYIDIDNDMVGNATEECVDLTTLNGGGYAYMTGDCDDTNPDISPISFDTSTTSYDCIGGIQLVNNAATCNGARTLTLYESDGSYESYDSIFIYDDPDEDGYAESGASGFCNYLDEPLDNYETTLTGDCEPDISSIYPGAPELCDGVDNQCPQSSSSVDEGCISGQSCIDTDGGQLLNFRGLVNITDLASGVVINTYIDTCDSTTLVKEYYCSGDEMALATINCPSGERCVDGECILEEEQVSNPISNPINFQICDSNCGTCSELSNANCVIRISDSDNAHIEKCSETNYPKVLCADVGVLDDSSKPIIGLYSDTNSHAASPISSATSYVSLDISDSYYSCKLLTSCDALTYTGLSFETAENSHVSTNGLYNLKLCCGYSVSVGTIIDEDDDGFFAGSQNGDIEDCNDNDQFINPLAKERFNGKDDDCDGEIDEGMNWKQILSGPAISSTCGQVGSGENKYLSCNIINPNQIIVYQDMFHIPGYNLPEGKYVFRFKVNNLETPYFYNEEFTDDWEVTQGAENSNDPCYEFTSDDGKIKLLSTKNESAFCRLEGKENNLINLNGSQGISYAYKITLLTENGGTLKFGAVCDGVPYVDEINLTSDNKDVNIFLQDFINIQNGVCKPFIELNSGNNLLEKVLVHSATVIDYSTIPVAKVDGDILDLESDIDSDDGWTTFSSEYTLSGLDEEDVVKVELNFRHSVDVDDVRFYRVDDVQGDYQGFNSVEDFFANTPASCCPIDYCWNGTTCIDSEIYMTNNSIPPIFLDLEYDGYRCIKDRDSEVNESDWVFSEVKYDPFNMDFGHCPYPEMCFVTSPENEMHIDDPLYYGCALNRSFVADFTGAISSEFYTRQNYPNSMYESDFYCDDGAWSSRTKFLAMKLLEIVNDTDDDFVLFCDNPRSYNDYFSDFDGSLNYYNQKDLFLNLEIDNEELFNNLQENHFFNNFCILTIDDHEDDFLGETFDRGDTVILASSLNRNLTRSWNLSGSTTTVGDVLEEIFGSDCASADSSANSYEKCSNAELYYDSDLLSFIYSKSSLNGYGITDNDNIFSLLSSFFSNLYENLKDLFGLSTSLSINLDESVISEVDVFNRLYYARIFDDSTSEAKIIEGVNHKKYDRVDLELKDYAYFKFKGYDVCKPFNDTYALDFSAFSLDYLANYSAVSTCDVDIDTNTAKIIFSATTNMDNGYGDNLYNNYNELKPVWYDLTAKLRPR
ncbi:hypothetical protein C0585_07825 [Candidatus Woesearchaeota archaeon]|nr:MAG: hypothetical protein C0585_07825 [Candidatus Woesearchaeota archaeon]